MSARTSSTKGGTPYDDPRRSGPSPAILLLHGGEGKRRGDRAAVGAEREGEPAAVCAVAAWAGAGGGGSVTLLAGVCKSGGEGGGTAGDGASQGGGGDAECA